MKKHLRYLPQMIGVALLVLLVWLAAAYRPNDSAKDVPTWLQVVAVCLIVVVIAIILIVAVTIRTMGKSNQAQNVPRTAVAPSHKEVPINRPVRMDGPLSEKEIIELAVKCSWKRGKEDAEKGRHSYVSEYQGVVLEMTYHPDSGYSSLNAPGGLGPSVTLTVAFRGRCVGETNRHTGPVVKLYYRINEPEQKRRQEESDRQFRARMAKDPTYLAADEVRRKLFDK